MLSETPSEGAHDPRVLGRVAAVGRTLKWWASSPAHRNQASFLGANCTRMLDQALSGIEVTPDDPLVVARDLMRRWDDASDDEREELLGRVAGILEREVPLSQLGARLPVLPHVSPPAPVPEGQPEASAAELVDAEASSVRVPEALSVPQEGGAVAGDAGSSVAEPAVEAGGAESAPARLPLAAVPLAGAPKPKPDPLDLEIAALRASRDQDRKGRSEVVERQRSRLPMGHVDGTGVELAVLGLPRELAAHLGEAGIETVADLLMLRPASAERFPAAHLDDASKGTCIYRGHVRTVATRFTEGESRFELVFTVDERPVLCAWKGIKPRGWRDWHPGFEIGIVGLLRRTVIETAEGEQSKESYELLGAEPLGLDGRGSGWMSVYKVPGISEQLMRHALAEAVVFAHGSLRDVLPSEVEKRHELIPFEDALRDCHFPPNASGKGRRRLAFEEALLLQLGLALKAAAAEPVRGHPQPILHQSIASLEWRHGQVLDDQQEKTFSEIRRDLVRPLAMRRLVQSAGGISTWVVNLYAAITVAEGGGQVAFVASDRGQAERRFLFAEGVLKNLGLVSLLVDGAPGVAQGDAIRRGEAHIVFGTSELVEAKVQWRKLGLVIAEEQGQVGTLLPGHIKVRGTTPDLLVCTGTPVPSEVALTVFGGFDLSVVAEGGEVSSRSYPAAERSTAYEELQAEISAGRQATLVFPTRDGAELLGVEDARRMAEALRAEAFPDARIGIYSASMSRDERLRVYEDFSFRRIDLLICTSFIEDAPVVENASAMVVEYADRYDPRRLHRLRSWCRRTGQAGRCIFVLSDAADEARRRAVELVCAESDGFRLAELDWQERGKVPYLGDRTIEVPSLTWIDPTRDRLVLSRARAEAFLLVRKNPGLTRYAELLAAVRDRFGEWLGDEALDAPQQAKGRGRRRRRRRR